MSLPSTRMRPPVMTPLRGKYRTVAYAVVDLPQPDSPTRPYDAPGRTSNETPPRTGRRMPRTTYERDRSSTFRAACVGGAGDNHGSLVSIGSRSGPTGASPRSG